LNGDSLKEILSGLSLYLEKHELSYVVLIILLFIFPRILSRFGIPLSLGAFLMGIISSLGLELNKASSVITTFALLGISSLFLYAGLEVDFTELKRNSKPLLQHVLIRILLLCFFSWALMAILSLKFKISVLIALALLTPSTGFILESIHFFKITDNQKSWVKIKAIASEMVALLILVLVQSGSPFEIIATIVTLILLIFSLPILFEYVSKKVSVTVPGSDFSFLLLLAVTTGTITKKLGAYYLVGAFLVGFTVNFYEKYVAKSSNKEFELAARFFAAFFMPFYFFNAGIKLDPTTLSFGALFTGIIFLMTAIPFRISTIIFQRKIFMKNTIKESLPISIGLLPTLVFGLVLADILKDTGEVSDNIIGGVVLYTIAATILPSIYFKYVSKYPNVLSPSTDIQEQLNSFESKT
jgi:Kef-type K+ transport system membrane component KefB